MDQKPPLTPNSHRYKFFNLVKNALPFFVWVHKTQEGQTAISQLFLVQMTSNFGKWLAWLVSSFGILYKNSVSYWKKGVFANLPKKLTYYHIRTWTAFWSNSWFLVWFVGGKNCPFPLCVISCPYIWYIFNLRSFGPRNNRGIAVWPSLHLHSPFFGKSAKTPFFQ